MNARDLRAALDWQIDLGADEAILDAPVNRFEAPENGEYRARLADPDGQILAESEGFTVAATFAER